MRPDEAAKLVATLFAAYPQNREHLTAAVYIDKLLPLQHGECQRAVDELIYVEKWMPPIALIFEVYGRILEQQRLSRPALPEPEVSPEQRAENVRQAQALLARLDGSREHSPIAAALEDLASEKAAA